MIVTPGWATNRSTYDPHDSLTDSLIRQGVAPGEAYRQARRIVAMRPAFDETARRMSLAYDSLCASVEDAVVAMGRFADVAVSAWMGTKYDRTHRR